MKRLITLVNAANVYIYIYIYRYIIEKQENQ